MPDDGQWSTDNQLNSVRQRGERKVTDLHRRKNCATATNGFSQFFYVIQHDDRAFVETEVLDREFDLTVLDIERSVTRQTCLHECLLIYHTDIPETGNENSFFCILDQVFG